MKVFFKDQMSLLNSILNDDLKFKNKESKCNLVNAICEGCIRSMSDDLNVFSFQGHTDAYDLFECYQEIVEYSGIEIDWYDILFNKVLAYEIVDGIICTTDLPYSESEISVFVKDLLLSWKDNVYRYLKENLE